MIFTVLFMGLFGISTYAQGLWMADSTTNTVDSPINAAIEITTGITGLTLMHSDAANSVYGHGDPLCLDTTYNDVAWNNKAFLQGSTNGMYYAIHTASEGSLDLALKMSSNKKTFVLELTSSCPGYDDLATLTTTFPTGDQVFANTAYFTLPTVFDTYNRTEATWDGSTAIQVSGASVFMFMSFDVAADKTYVVGCLGSKMMVRGINYVTAISGLNDIDAVQAFDIFPNPASGNVTITLNKTAEIGIYNTVGLLLKQQLVTTTDNTLDISGLESGVYFIKEMNSNRIQKLVIK